MSLCRRRPAVVMERTQDRSFRFFGGRVGRMSATDCLAVGQALRQGVIAQGVVSEAEYDRLFSMAQEEFARPKGTGVLPFYRAFGQRVA